MVDPTAEELADALFALSNEENKEFTLRGVPGAIHHSDIIDPNDPEEWTMWVSHPYLNQREHGAPSFFCTHDKFEMMTVLAWLTEYKNAT